MGVRALRQPVQASVKEEGALSQGSEQPLGAGEDKEMNLLLAPPPKGMMDTLILPQ